MLQANQLESWSNIAEIVGVIVAVLVAVGGGIKYFLGKKSEEKRNKQEKLTEPYNKLLRLISLFPNKTPYDVMALLSDSPSFNLEGFDTVNRILKIQIKEDYQKQLEREDLTYQDKEDIKIEIHNRELCIEEITRISKKYFAAKQKYEQFRSNDKLIKLYSSQEVKNCLVEFEVLLNNAFIAGRTLEYNDGSCNKLDNIRWKLEQIIRDDIGIR